MAIDDNTSYELTGAQVKDLAARIKAADKPLYTALGENTDGAMTQKAVREALYDDTDLKKIKIGSKQFSSDVVGDFSVGIGKSVIQSGTEGVAIGRWAEARGNYSVAIGPNSSTANNAPSVAIGYHAATNHSGAFAHAVALGDYSAPSRNYEVNIGTGSQDGYDGANDHTRVLGGVHAGILGTDAVNVDQLTAAIPGVFTGTDGTTAGASGLVPAPTTADGSKYLKGDGTWGEVQIPPARTMLYLQNNIPSLASSFYIYKDFDLTEAITWDEMMALLDTDTGGEVALRVASSSDCVFCIVSFEHETEQFGVVDASKEYGSPAAYFFHADYNDQTRSKFVVETQDLGGSLVEMSYGEANAWAKFIAAYQAGKIVYCRASSATNPATGTQGRKAFMAYVNNAENPTEVEFQYVRSVSSKTASQPVDQVFVYKLTNASGGTWTVESRNMAPKLAAGSNVTVSYSSGTYTISATGGGGGGVNVVQTTGQSTTDVMSQKAVTDIIGNVETILQTLNSGNGAQ